MCGARPDVLAGGLYSPRGSLQCPVLEEISLPGSPGRVIPVACDARVPQQVEELFNTAERQHWTVAGRDLQRRHFQETGCNRHLPGGVRGTAGVSVASGGFLVGGARLLAPCSLQGTGTILFTGATASLRGGAGFANLASPEFALRAIAQSLARELSPKGIHVAHVIIDGQIHSRRYAAPRLATGAPILCWNQTQSPKRTLDFIAQHRSAWTHELDHATLGGEGSGGHGTCSR